MGEDIKDFRVQLKTLANIADIIEENEIFKGEDIVVRMNLEKTKYESILKNFREIDWKSEKFFINIGNVSFKFVLKK